jgi:hypothetical protein
MERCMRRSIVVPFTLGFVFATSLFAATATELVPTSAPHGARMLVVGSGLDAGTVAVTFAAFGGATVAAPILSRTPQFVEVSVPATAIT